MADVDTSAPTPAGAADAGRRFTLTFSDGGCLPAIRRIIRWMLVDADEDRREAAEMVCTELVTNALDHADPPRAISLTVDDGQSLQIVVVDGSPGTDPVPGHSRLGDHRGRGLTMVDRLSTSWCVTRNATTKAVRAVIG